MRIFNFNSIEREYCITIHIIQWTNKKRRQQKNSRRKYSDNVVIEFEMNANANAIKCAGGKQRTTTTNFLPKAHFFRMWLFKKREKWLCQWKILIKFSTCLPSVRSYRTFVGHIFISIVVSNVSLMAPWLSGCIYYKSIDWKMFTRQWITMNHNMKLKKEIHLNEYGYYDSGADLGLGNLFLFFIYFL